MHFSPRGNLDFNFPEQLISSGFDVGVAVFMRASFHGEQTATMQRLKIAEWKFVMRFTVNFVMTVDSQIPLGVFFKATKSDEFILLRG